MTVKLRCANSRTLDLARDPALTLTVIRADERGAPKNRKKIEWKLLTDLPVQSRGDAIEKLEWYSGLPQDTQIRLLGRGLATADCSAIDESDLGILHCELAHFFG
ncbi:hypothetical protein [Bradyrhizobium brasilense]|uniref:hypothetical protein n=1 Tax=Bradyrhizobium brasilense TaxID=1419277 RepID=UPI001AED17F9|nr:hypothetical protein [Bradyrhizobium brasilense]